MIWFYERHRDRLHYEIRHQPDGPDYELVITYPDGRQEVERFSNPMALLERSRSLQTKLSSAGWQPPEGRPRIRYA